MNYPHFLFDPVSLLYVGLDTVQQLSRTSTSSSQRYTQSSTGNRKQVTAKDLSSGAFECTIYSSGQRIEWYLDYLTGRDIIFGYGPRDMASYVNIENVDVLHVPGNTLKVSFNVTFLGPVRGQFRDASDSRCTGGTLVTDTAATLDTAAQLSSQGQVRQFIIPWSVTLLPTGNYRMFARVRDTAQVSNDVHMSISAGSTIVASWYKTSTASYVVYMIDFTITNEHTYKDFTFKVRKNLSTPNNIYVDYLGCVSVP